MSLRVLVGLGDHDHLGLLLRVSPSAHQTPTTAATAAARDQPDSLPRSTQLPLCTLLLQ